MFAQQKVNLKSGETLECEVVSLINGTLTVKFKGNIITLKQTDIELIDFENNPSSSKRIKNTANPDATETEIPAGSTIEYTANSRTGVLMVLYLNENGSRIQTVVNTKNTWTYTFKTTKPNQKLLFHSWSNNRGTLKGVIKINGKIVKEGEGDYVQLTVNTTFLETSIK
jgi:hypothetical protein